MRNTGVNTRNPFITSKFTSFLQQYAKICKNKRKQAFNTRIYYKTGTFTEGNRILDVYHTIFSNLCTSQVKLITNIIIGPLKHTSKHNSRVTNNITRGY